MNHISGKTIRDLRLKNKITQKELAEKLHLSDKTISKWETERGLPDISLAGELAAALGVSLAELFSGDLKLNRNTAGNIRRTKFYVCPVCGNMLSALGEAQVSCHGISLSPEKAKPADSEHDFIISIADDEYLLETHHPMTKEHYISFAAYISFDSLEIVKLYPEQNVSVRFHKKGSGTLYLYCSRDGLYSIPLNLKKITE